MYCAMLVALDGEYVLDYKGETVQDVVHALADRGSAWFFYPLPFVVKLPFSEENRVILPPECLEHYKNKKIKNVLKMLRNENFKNIE